MDADKLELIKTLGLPYCIAVMFGSQICYEILDDALEVALMACQCSNLLPLIYVIEVTSPRVMYDVSSIYSTNTSITVAQLKKRGRIIY